MAIELLPWQLQSPMSLGEHLSGSCNHSMWHASECKENTYYDDWHATIPQFQPLQLADVSVEGLLIRQLKLLHSMYSTFVGKKYNQPPRPKMHNRFTDAYHLSPKTRNHNQFWVQAKQLDPESNPNWPTSTKPKTFVRPILIVQFDYLIRQFNSRLRHALSLRWHACTNMDCTWCSGMKIELP